MDKIIILPGYLREGVRPLKNHYPNKVNLMAFDIETENGRPYFLDHL